MNGKEQLSIWQADRANIWNYKQNHPELVVRDIARYFPVPIVSWFIQRLVRQSLLCRGINKWLKVRRDLIAYKKQIKHEVKDLQAQIPELKRQMTEQYVADFTTATAHDVVGYFRAREQYLITKELLKYKERVRADLKAMCMTDRWQEWHGRTLEDMNTLRASDKETK